MWLVIAVCVLAVAASTLLHYEALSFLNARLPSWRFLHRVRVLVVVLAAFFAHAAEVAVYGMGTFLLVNMGGSGSLDSPGGSVDIATCFYFAAQSYTSLGFGDVAPHGAIRLVAVTAAINGLLLIAWSASFIYLEMERYWRTRDDRTISSRGHS